MKGEKSLTAVLNGAELTTAPAALFPGACADAQLWTVLTCVTQRVACRACTSVNAVDGVAMDCDTVDDGAVNASCP